MLHGASTTAGVISCDKKCYTFYWQVTNYVADMTQAGCTQGTIDAASNYAYVKKYTHTRCIRLLNYITKETEARWTVQGGVYIAWLHIKFCRNVTQTPKARPNLLKTKGT